MQVIVTGAGSGLGAAVAGQLLRKGHTVYALVHSLQRCGALNAALPTEKLEILQADLSDPGDIEHAVAEIASRTACVDAVVNAAGVLLKKEEPLTENTYADIEMTFRINTFAPIYLNNLALPLLRRAKAPILLNVCSEIRAIEDVGDWFPLYCFSKTALTQYCFSMQVTLKKTDPAMRVFAVHPGRMRTAMGGANSEIDAETSARGIVKILCAPQNYPDLYLDYQGNPMLEPNRKQ